jgi:hypothetical protein
MRTTAAVLAIVGLVGLSPPAHAAMDCTPQSNPFVYWEKCTDDKGAPWACNLNHDGKCYPQANPIPQP